MTDAGSPLLEIRLLRGPSVATDGREVVVPGPLRRRLLWRLAVAGGAAVDTATLIGAVWPTDPPRTAAAMIGSHVARLRSVLAAHGLPADRLLPRSAGGHRIDGDLVRVDVHALAGRVAACREAGAGAIDPIDGVVDGAIDGVIDEALGDLQRYLPAGEEPSEEEPWLHDAVEDGWLSIREICRVALGGVDTRAGERRSAVTSAVTAMAGRWPYDETVAAWQVELLARSGRPAEALRAAAEVRERLADELGVGPSDDLVRAHAFALRQGDTRGPTTDRSDRLPDGPVRLLPRPPEVLLGRDADLTRLRALTSRAARARTAVTVVTITGAPGVGTSAVASTLAAELAADHPAGQLHLALHPRPWPDGTDPAAAADRELGDALGTALTALGVAAADQPPRTGDRAALLRSLTADHAMLWVIDDALPWHGLAAVLPTAGGSTVLATSVVPHPDLLGARGVGLAPLDAADADRLLALWAGPTRGPGDREDRRRAVVWAAGRPAALRGCAGRLRSPAHRPGDHPTSWGAGDPGSTWAASLDRCRDGLGPVARAAVSGLGRLPGRAIDRRRVAGLLGLGADDGDAVLDDLVAVGLLEAGDGPDRTRLGVPAAVAEHAGRAWVVTVDPAGPPADVRGLRPRLVSGDS